MTRYSSAGGRVRLLVGVVCGVIGLSSIGGPAATGTAAERPLEFVEKGEDKLQGVTVCPDGYAVEGIHVDKGWLLCHYYALGKPDVFIDYSTQRDGMHACPEGTYMRGYVDSRNMLVCSYDIDSGSTVFASGDIRSAPGPARDGMHVCSTTDYQQVMVGIHAGKNVLLCRVLPQSQPAPTLDVSPTFDPTGERGALASGLPLATWRAVTLNWLTHVLDLPLPGEPGDPRCISLSRSFASLAGVFGAQSPTSNCGGGGRPIELLSIQPAHHWNDLCNHWPWTHVEVNSQGYTASGVRMFVVRYRSPVLSRLVAPAYLLLPRGYAPSGSYPTVLVTHGHTAGTFFKEGYQNNPMEGLARCPEDADHADALALAEAGAITFAPDTITFPGYETGESSDDFHCWKSFVEGSNAEATCALPLGTLMHRYLLDQLVRVSLLETIPGVDHSRIYTAGLSLGGWQALWTAALDPRIKRVAVAGIFEALNRMESSSLNDADQEVPALSTDFWHGQKDTIADSSMLIRTPDIAALIMGHAALLSTWGAHDTSNARNLTPNIEIDQAPKPLPKNYGTLGETEAEAARIGGSYTSEVTQGTLGWDHEFFNYLPLDSSTGAHPAVERARGAVPFLLAPPPSIAISAPPPDQFIFYPFTATLHADIAAPNGDPYTVTWYTNTGAVGTGNPLNAQLGLGDTFVSALVRDQLTGATATAEIPVEVTNPPPT